MIRVTSLYMRTQISVKKPLQILGAIFPEVNLLLKVNQATARRIAPEALSNRRELIGRLWVAAACSASAADAAVKELQLPVGAGIVVIAQA